MAKTFKSGVTLLILTFFCSIFIFGNSAILKNVNAAAKINQSSSSTQIASVKYKIKDGTITIYGKGKMPNSMTFKKNRQIHTVIIRNGVTSVSKYAFYNCKNLQKVKLPNTLKVINCYAFYGTKIKNPLNKNVYGIINFAISITRNRNTFVYYKGSFLQGKRITFSTVALFLLPILLPQKM